MFRGWRLLAGIKQRQLAQQNGSTDRIRLVMYAHSIISIDLRENLSILVVTTCWKKWP